MSDPADRLDSWKAIAEYLQRDERTLRRWEKQGLPVRRVAGSAGHSVFAFKSEIDAWLVRRPTAAPGPASTGVSEPIPVIPPSRTYRVLRPALALVLLLAIALSWQMLAPDATGQVLKATISQTGVTAVDDRGGEVWRHDFPFDVLTLLSHTAADPTVVARREPAGVYALTSFVVRRGDAVHGGGALRFFGMDGRLRQTFSFDDRWTFSDGRTYEGPWALTDFRVDDRYGRRIAVAAHHLEWWPSIVTLLDGMGRRQGTFIHSGWVETLRWIDGDRLAASGFSNAHDGGMLTVLDANRIDGSSPEDTAGGFSCVGCPDGRPMFYAVFPRSELNRVTGSGFNRAWINLSDTRLSVRTAELDRPDEIGPLTDVIYTFSDDLTFVDARFSDRYWDRHRQLELEGRIRHSRAQCPDRDGPPPISIWTPVLGWQTVSPSR